jgi:hypothetical protein
MYTYKLKRGEYYEQFGKSGNRSIPQYLQRCKNGKSIQGYEKQSRGNRLNKLE